MLNEIVYIYPATSLQQGFIYHALSQPDDDAYRMQVLFDYHQPLDVAKYAQAWEYCIVQYPILRTAFNWEEDIIQVIYKKGKLNYQLHDVSHLPSQQEKDNAIDAIQSADRKIGYDLTSPTLLRVHIIKQAADYYTVLKSQHHAITDGWSEPVLLASLHKYYQALTKGGPVIIKEDSAYIEAQEYIAVNKAGVQQYWDKAFVEEETANDINALLSAPFDAGTYRRVEQPAEKSYEISDDFYTKLKSFSQKESITVNVILQFAWHKLLQVYSAKSSSIVGTTVSGRDLPIDGIEESVGLYVNTLPLAIDWENDFSIKEQLNQIQQKIIELNAHSFADLAKIQKNGERIFHSLFVYENYPTGKDGTGGIKITTRNDIDKVDYPLGILAFEDGDKVVFTLQYDGNYLTGDKAGKHVETLAYFLQQVIANPEKKHKQLSLLTPEAYRQAVYEWNITDKDYPQEKTIHALFEEQAERSPDNTAIVYHGAALSYRELNEKSNQLAREIREQYRQKNGRSLSPDDLIALCANRGLEMIIAILAVLKAGAAYVPIDPSQPTERISYLLADTGAALILSQRQLNKDGKLQLPEGKVVYIDLEEPLYNKNATANLTANCTSRNLAYVIYTSGTTGQPKGVMVEHTSVSNEILSQLTAIPINSSDSSLLTADIIFDAAAECIYMSLLSGGALHILDSGSVLDGDFVRQYLDSSSITVVNTTPSYLKAISIDSSPAHLKYIILGGEPYQKIESSARIFNSYGPTETTIVSTLTEINNGGQAHIGKPINNTRAYVLDANNQPVPIGVTGELHIGGAGLARGYLNRHELTIDRFIPNTFATTTDKAKGYTRLYKTGDLVRWQPDGNLEYIGRNDEQVKINGYRIELAEVTHAVTAIAGIKQACVLAKERKTGTAGTKYLVCYYVAEKGDDVLSSSTIQSKLSDILPSYMVPGIFVAMESFPLTVNGKLDKRALPDPDFDLPATDHAAPVTEIEKELCKIWEQVFGIENISITDNFFRIGGDSILSIQVSGRIRQAGYPCQVKDIFEYKTISELAAHLSEKSRETGIEAEQGALTGELGFLPIQEWFISQAGREFTKPGHWNQSFLIKVPELDTKRLESAIGDLVAHHDVFRILYVKQPAWKQFYQAEISVPKLKNLDVSKHMASQIREILTTWQSGFDLEHGPLFQTGYLHGYTDGSARIFIAMHHMIVDSVSWRILTEDLKNLYSGIQLQQKSSSYRQWVMSVKKYTALHPGESVYWEEQLKGIPAYQPVQQQEPSERTFELTEGLTASLLQEASKAYHTEVNDLLLTALAYALKDINHADTQSITLEAHGREEIDPLIDHSRTVGWFTTMFPVKVELKSSIKESIQFIKESLRKVPNKGIGFGAFATGQETPYTQNDLPLTSFNYLGQFDGSADDWQIVSEDSGKNVDNANADHNLIFIDGMVSGGKLKFSVGTRLGELVTKQLSNSFRTQLTSIIAHCIETLENKGSNYTPGDFKAVKISQSLLNKLAGDAKLNQNQIDHIYPATSLQQGFIYHALSQPDDDAYRMQVLYDYHQPLDIAKYIKAWEYCIARYPGLRTAFNWEEDIIQVIYKKGKLDYRLHDLSHLATRQEKDNAIDAIQTADKETGYDLTCPALLRINIIKLATDYYTVLKSEHHAITDGWSEPVLLASLHKYYQALTDNKLVIINQDAAYIAAQEYISANKNHVQQYWNKAFAEAETANDISALLSEPFDAGRYRRVEKPADEKYEIRDDFYTRLKSFSQKEGITINVVLQFAWHKLLQVYSANSLSIVGTTVSGRDLPVDGIEESVGLYVNTLPLAVDWENDFSVREQLYQIQQKIIELNTHSFADLAKIQKNGERLFHSLFVYENYPEPKESESILKITSGNVADRLDYPIGLIVFEQDGALVVRLVYDANYLNETDARSHLSEFNRIIIQVIDNAGKSHQQISLLSADDHNKIINNWNITDNEYPGEKTVVQLFEEQVVKTPGNIALVYDGKQLSYNELNKRSNQLAHYIRTQYQQRTGQELATDTLIALYLHRGLEMVIAILAVLKAGGAYVPVEINYPQERVDFILRDGDIKLILTQRHLPGNNYQAKLPGELVINAGLFESIYTTADTNNLPARNAAKDLACILYTSGTTGKPKGVMLTHISVANRVLCMIERSGISVKDYYLFKTNYVFDVSVSDIFTHLCAGAKLQLTKQVFDLTELKQLIQTVEFTSLHLVPSQYDLLSETINESSIRKLYFSGEAITPQIIAGVNQNIEIFNYYGPTETGEITLSNPKVAQEYAIIGRVFPNSRHYVLDTGGMPVPIGVTGELFIGGASLARGYLNRPDISEERFINNPFATGLDKELGYTKLYKTGDLVRWLPDGNLVYIGRNDGQVKISGYRIEVGEIEHALAQISGIKQSCVLAKERQTSAGTVKYLVAYYVADKDGDSLNEAMIASHLSQLLPGYMIPGAFVEMESFPLTINGKLDKRALPEPDFGALIGQFIAPTTELEAGLCQVWEQVLGVERVGLTDDFFGMGGNSILAIQASHRMGSLLGYDVKVGEIFKHKNINQILSASFIEIVDDSLNGREFEI